MKKIISSLVMFGMVLSTVGTAPLKVFADHDQFGGTAQTSVEICHKLGNGDYNGISPSISATGQVNGHGGDSEDIIPPFHYLDGNNVLQSSAGLNWNSTNEDIWASGDCNGDGIINVPENTLLLCTDGIDNDQDNLTDVGSDLGNDPDCDPFLPKLTVTKIVNGGALSPGDFALSVDNTAVNSGQQYTYTINGHVVAETPVANYTGVIGGDCALNGTITLVAGDVKNCTITNTFISNTPTDTGSIKICKVIQNSEGVVTKGNVDATFTIPFLDEDYEGTAAGTPSSAVFTTPLTPENVFGTVEGECVTIDGLAFGRYYYGQEQISDSSEWETPLYNDGYTMPVTNLSMFGDFNTNLDPQYNDFDGVINIDSNNPSRTLLVLNKEKPAKDKADYICHATTVDPDSYEKMNPNDVDILVHIDQHNDDIIPPYGDYQGKNWNTEGQAIWNNKCEIPIHENVTVTITKYIHDGETTVAATAGNTNNATFTFDDVWAASNLGSGSGSGSNDLGPVSYSNTTPEMTYGTSDYAVEESIADNSDIMVSECTANTVGKYVLEGYKIGDTAELALASEIQASASLVDITSNKHILIINKKCGEIVTTQTSTVTMCKVNGNQQPLSGWTLMLKGDAVQSDLNVPSNTSAGVNSNALVAGVSYIAETVGTWLNQNGGPNPVDTEYSTTDAWATHMDGYTGFGTDILELQINSAFDPNSNWGAYNTAHTYAQSFIPSGTSANFRIFDGTGTTPNQDWYGDNTGSLSVDINKGYAGITGQNGCVTFSNVPYGTYTTDEILQDNWTNVSGLQSVTVDAPTETFTVTNRYVSPTPPVCVEGTQNETQTIVSNSSTLSGGNPTVAIPLPFHDWWTALIPGSPTWIWDVQPLADYVGTTTRTFTRDFTITGTPTGATLDIAADNSYTVSINGNLVNTDNDPSNFFTPDTLAIPAGSLYTGTNTITFTVTNWAQAGGRANTNPAGLLYKLSVNSDECVVPNGGDEDPISDLSVTKTVNDNTPDENQSITYTITATNSGPDNATGVVVNDLLPAGLTYVSNVASQGTYTNGTGIWTVGSLADDVSATLTITATVNSDTEGDTIINTATVDGDQDDNGSTNNSSTVSVTVNTDGSGNDNPQCSDGVDNGDTEDTLADEDDPGCHAGNNLNAAYDPNDNDETNSTDNTPSNNTSNGGGSSGGRRGAPLGQVLGEATDICDAVDTYMRVGHKNVAEQVLKLQNFLNGYLNAGLIVNGIYGLDTEKSVKTFQSLRKEKVLTPWGITAPTGIFYKTSLAEAKRLMCPDEFGNLPIPTDLINWNVNMKDILPPKL